MVRLAILGCAAWLGAVCVAVAGDPPLARAARDSAAEVRRLSEALVAAADLQHQAELEAAEARAAFAAETVAAEAASAEASRLGARRDRALALLSRIDRGAKRPAAEAAGRLGAAQALDAIEAKRAARERGRAAEARRRGLAASALTLAAAERALSARQQETARLLAERRARHERLAAALAQAERHARTQARKARTLAGLAQAVGKRPSVSRSGERTAAEADRRRLPVVGRITTDGAGLAITASAGATVVAPQTGLVAYAGPFRGYGEVLILEGERDYALVLTGLEAIGVRVGQRVMAGEPVAQAAAHATPVRLEVRRRGVAVDARTWLSVE